MPKAALVAATEHAGAGWWVYILRCADGSLYTGVARDVAARLAVHESGRGARYTRGRGPLTLLHVEPAATHGDALRRESAIRRLGREGKEQLCAATAAMKGRGRPRKKPTPSGTKRGHL